MAKLIRWNTINPKRLAAAGQKQLVHELYAIQQQIFAGENEDHFAVTLLRPRARRNRVRVFLNTRRQIIGYQGLHLFETRMDNGEPIAVFRAEAGLLRSYRRRHLTLRLAMREFLRYRLFHPWRRAYFFSDFVHPSSYHLACQHCSELYPSQRQETPPEILKLMDELAAYFKFDQRDPERPMVIYDGWQVRDKAAERVYWARSKLPDVRYFLQMNPHYDQGWGLLTLIPLNSRNLLRGLRGYLGDLLAHPRKPGPNNEKR